MTAAERQRKRRQAITETIPARPAPEITKAEAAELQKLINRRERVLKKVAGARSAELLTDFEQQMAAIYKFDDREVWAEATRRGTAAVDQANDRIAAECAKLGIPANLPRALSLAGPAAAKTPQESGAPSLGGLRKPGSRQSRSALWWKSATRR
jgi:hypothetical protein